MYNINIEKTEVKKNWLWTKNFTLLWLGQFVSSLGDSFYGMALSVFILDITGSVSFLGFIKAVSLIPRIIISPFAGAVADSHDRKKIIVLSDLICGIALILLFIAIKLGYTNLWMFLVVGIIIGIASCFFNPAVNSVIPDVVDKDNLIKANSSLSIIYKGNSLLGSAAAGTVINLIGAPLLFLFNGISFIFSAASESFIEIPKSDKKVEKVNYFKDVMAGARYVIRNKGLVYLYIVVAFLNFFGSIGFMLALPYFKMTEGLGIQAYGIALSFSSAGLIVGFSILPKVDLKKVSKFSLFIMSGVITSVAMIAVANVNSVFLTFLLMFCNGLGISITNSILQVTFQRKIPRDLRGKVFGFKKMLGLSLVPIALMVGGVLAEIFTTRVVICFSYFILLLLFLVTSTVKDIREYINID